jgi:hypothetical protein
VKLKKGGVYEIKGSAYDDDNSYFIKINSDLIYDYYRVSILGTYSFDTKIYPEDWEYIRELSSLEKELL